MPLHPQVKQMLDVMYASEWQDYYALTPIAGRAQSLYYGQLRQFPQPLPAVTITDHYVPREDKQRILLRYYEGPSITSNAVILYYHGGGYVVGSVEQYDSLCRWFTCELATPVISVNYRLAPEQAFPTPIEDGYAALIWVAEHAKQLGIEGKDIIVAGDSAGAHLATMASILARDRKGPAIAQQWLFYPWVDNDFSRPSYQKYAEGFGLSAATMRYFTELYLHHDQIAAYPAFPFHIDNLSQLPPAYVIMAECDVLHDEGNDYVEKLKAAGNQVISQQAAGMIHGFLGHYPIPAAYATVMNVFEQLRKLLL